MTLTYFSSLYKIIIIKKNRLFQMKSGTDNIQNMAPNEETLKG